jgi:hypothetical protein
VTPELVLGGCLSAALWLAGSAACSGSERAILEWLPGEWRAVPDLAEPHQEAGTGRAGQVVRSLPSILGLLGLFVAFFAAAGLLEIDLWLGLTCGGLIAVYLTYVEVVSGQKLRDRLMAEHALAPLPKNAALRYRFAGSVFVTWLGFLGMACFIGWAVSRPFAG